MVRLSVLQRQRGIHHDGSEGATIKRLSDLPVLDGVGMAEREPQSASYSANGAFRVGRTYSQPSDRLKKPIVPIGPGCPLTRDVCFFG
jgi:hypothetical protein